MLTESLVVFLCKENQEGTNIELGELKGFFDSNPIIVLAWTAEDGLPQMTWQRHFSISLMFLPLLKVYMT